MSLFHLFTSWLIKKVKADNMEEVVESNRESPMKLIKQNKFK